MTKKIAVFLAPGFEEIEAVTPIDVLRRAGCEVLTVAVGANGKIVPGAHGIPVTADCLVEELQAAALDMTIFPGGLPGATNLAANPLVLAAARTVYDKGGIAAAICAAPIALAAAGILDGHAYTCYPSFERKIGGNYTASRVENSKRIITACGPGASLEFALELVRALGIPADSLAQGMLAK